MKTPTRITPSTITKSSVDSTGSQLVRSAGADLEEHQREADRDREREDDLTAADLRSGSRRSRRAPATATFAEIASARKPIASDSPSATTPRMTGSRQIRPALHRRRDVLHDLRTRQGKSGAPIGTPRRTVDMPLPGQAGPPPVAAAASGKAESMRVATVPALASGAAQ